MGFIGEGGVRMKAALRSQTCKGLLGQKTEFSGERFSKEIKIKLTKNQSVTK